MSALFSPCPATGTYSHLLCPGYASFVMQRVVTWHVVDRCDTATTMYHHNQIGSRSDFHSTQFSLSLMSAGVSTDGDVE